MEDFSTVFPLFRHLLPLCCEKKKAISTFPKFFSREIHREKTKKKTLASGKNGFSPVSTAPTIDYEKKKYVFGKGNRKV